jgi:hypothetical protein
VPGFTIGSIVKNMLASQPPALAEVQDVGGHGRPRPWPRSRGHHRAAHALHVVMAWPMSPVVPGFGRQAALEGLVVTSTSRLAGAGGYPRPTSRCRRATIDDDGDVDVDDVPRAVRSPGMPWQTMWLGLMSGLGVAAVARSGQRAVVQDELAPDRLSP